MLKRIISITLLITVFLVFHIKGYSQADSTEENLSKYIQWSENYPLSWDDFKTVSDLEGEYSAISWTLIKRNQIGLFDEKLSLRVVTYFIRDKSVVEKVQKTESLLRHERLHWDIAELFARKLRKRYSEHISENLEDSYSFFNQEYDNMLKTKSEFQTEYDIETELSNNKEKQEEWEIRITKLLNEYSDYADTKVIVARSIATD